MNPVRAKLQSDLVSGHTKLKALHPPAKFAAGLDDLEVIDAALVKRSGRDDTGYSAPEDENLSVLVRSIVATHRGSLGRDSTDCAEGDVKRSPSEEAGHVGHEGEAKGGSLYQPSGKLRDIYT